MASLVGHVLTLADDILAEILILLPSLADIGRACASCPEFRRVITGHAFLRRLHALHPPSLLGFHTFSGGFQPAELPHTYAPAARAIAGAVDFSFSFLPSLGCWMVRDARDGRFLLDCDERKNKTFTTIAVCDPLFRRYVLLPPMPQDLAATVLLPPMPQDLAATVDQPHLVNAERRCDIFLAPCGEGEDPESFRVIWMAQCSTKLVAFIFSSANRQWRAIASPSWRDLNPEMPSMTEHRSLSCRNYAYGRFYWLLSNFPGRSKLLVLDMGRMEFSPVNPPFGVRVQEFAIVELQENRLGMLASNCVEGSRLKFFCADRQNHGEETNEWVFQKKVSLAPSYLYYMLGVVDGQLLLQRTPNACDATEFGCISLDLKTFQIQWLRGMLKSGYRPLPTLYTGYPPSLSLPTI